LAVSELRGRFRWIIPPVSICRVAKRGREFLR
jgi:hypothetical protein